MARKKLKLYVWEGVLTDWTSGMAVALASSPEEAKAQLIKAGVYEHSWDGLKLDGVEPYVTEEPSGFFVYGGG